MVLKDDSMEERQATIRAVVRLLFVVDLLMILKVMRLGEWMFTMGTGVRFPLVWIPL